MNWLEVMTPMQRARHEADKRHLQDQYLADRRAAAQACADRWAERERACATDGASPQTPVSSKLTSQQR